MGFPTLSERNQSGLSELLRPSKPALPSSFETTIVEEESPIRTQMASRAALDFEPYHEVENNEDQKSPGYPDGPIAIYEDNVFLYLEPTADEASKFDVVINVAREVNNPFKTRSQSTAAAVESVPQAQTLSQPPPVDNSPYPDTALTAVSYTTAFEFPPPEEKSPETPTPTTPKASYPPKEPEYIHMPWDHNTDIAVDLMTLCETIEQRTKAGKRVLIHCQQGASRSASLIIAYGLYQNPELSVNDAYYAAQAKSRWISPNMKLMYCLQDFQKEVSKKKLPGSAFRPRAGRSPTKHRAALSVDAIDIVVPKEPLTAPLPNEGDSTCRSASPTRSPIRFRGNSTPGSQSISPGPSSAPSSFSWTTKEDEKDTQTFGRFNLEPLLSRSKVAQSESGFTSSRDMFAKPPPSPGFLPTLGFGSVAGGFGSSSKFGLTNLGGFHQNAFEKEAKDTFPHERIIAVSRPFPDDSALMSPRAETMTNNPFHSHEPFTDFSSGMHFVEIPPTPTEGLFSPRESMFPRDPFFPFGRPTQIEDPRSPPTHGETPIVRSIDELI
jgi:tyrosine-protein phosphatase MSG5